MSLIADRHTPERQGALYVLPVAAGVVIHKGALVCLDSGGYATPGATATTLRGVGRAEERADNSGGANGDKQVEVARGTFRFANSSGPDEITNADIGQACYVVDDETVAKTSGTNTRSRAGFVAGVDPLGVWVQLGIGLLDAPGGALAAANNLSDLGAASTGRANLGVDKIFLTIRVADLAGSAPVHLVAPLAGTITKISSVLDAPLATGDATITGKIGATPITGGVITIAESGSAAGDIDSVSPSAANAVTAGALISLTPGGSNTANVGASVLVEITF